MGDGWKSPPLQGEGWVGMGFPSAQVAARENCGVTETHPHPDLPLEGEGEGRSRIVVRSEEHTSELQSLMRISYAVFCLKKKTKDNTTREHSIIRNADRYTTLEYQHMTVTHHDIK